MKADKRESGFREVLARTALGFAAPEKEKLEAAIEAGEKCPKCGAGVRALARDAQEGNRVVCDLEILFDLYCRSACGWTSAQWRTWKASEPGKV